MFQAQGNFLDPEGESRKLFRNCGKYLPTNTASYPRRFESLNISMISNNATNKNNNELQKYICLVFY
jgi:hypothetical protein